MGEPILLTNASDTYVSEVQPNARLHRKTRLWLNAGGSNQRFAYIFFSRPFPLGVTITSATLRFYSVGDWDGTRQLTVRSISERWSVSRVRWNNRPAVRGRVQSISKTNAQDGEEWAINVLPELQAVSDGEKWWGFRVEIDDTINSRRLYSAEGPDRFRPTLEVSWSDAPDPPEELAPAGGRSIATSHPVLSTDFTDVSGDTDIESMQVQIAATEAAILANTPAFDSAEEFVSVPELPLVDTAYVGLADGEVVWWRAQVKDAAGLWSGWSDPDTFRRDVKDVITINNPAVAPNNFVAEPTPLISWSSSGIQRAYQLYISDPATNRWVWDTGKITSTDQSVPLPNGVLKKVGALYRLGVRVWDEKAREKNGNEPVFAEATRDFTFTLDNTTNPVTGLSATEDPMYSFVTLEWSRATMPDSWTILRDDEVVEANIEPTELFVAGTEYTYVDRGAPPREEHEYKVVAVVNGKGSGNNPIITATPRAITTCISRPDGTDAVLLFNPNNTFDKLGGSVLHETLDGPVLLMQGPGGRYVGTIAGRIDDHGPVTAQQFRNRLERLRQDTGRRMVLTSIDESFGAVIYNITWQSVAFPDGSTAYDVEAEFYQIDARTYV